MFIPMSTAQPVTRDPEQKREAILDAALDLFAGRGFHGTAIPEIAERARVSAGTIYRYFASKEALVNAVYQREKMSLAKALLPHELAGRAGPSPRLMLHEFFVAACRYGRERPLSLAFLEHHHHKDYLDQESRDLEQRMFAPALLFLRDAQEQMAVKKCDPELLIALVWGMFNGLMRGHAEKRFALDPAALAEAEECIWQAIRA
jgi:AcrR family transcriptional regulator